MGSPIPVALSVIQAAARRPDAPRSARARVSASLYASTGLTAWSSLTRTSAQTVAAWTRARPSTVAVDSNQQALEHGDHEHDRNQQEADPEEQERPPDVHPARG